MHLEIKNPLKKLQFSFNFVIIYFLMKLNYIDCKGQFKISKNKDRDSDMRWNKDKFYYMNQINFADPQNRFNLGIYFQ